MHTITRKVVGELPRLQTVELDHNARCKCVHGADKLPAASNRHHVRNVRALMGTQRDERAKACRQLQAGVNTSSVWDLTQ